MFGLHAPELIIVLVVALLIFGPKKLPEMGSAIGKSIKEFQKGMKEISTPKDAEQSAPKETIDALVAPPISEAEMQKLANASLVGEEVSAQHPND